MTGLIHSVESMGLVDGPGVRSVVFLQGCKLRCLYCHNPDTWDKCGKANEISADELVFKLLRFKPYFGEDGGVTVSGGEPLLQIDFLCELFEKLKQNNVHTCLDTAGVGDFSDPDYHDKLNRLFSVTDLILLDIKHHDPQIYSKITGIDMCHFNDFSEHLQSTDTKIWLRHVIVPKATDSAEHIRGLAKYISHFKNIQKIELIPYHTLGAHKYEKMGIRYPLEGMPAFDKNRIHELYNILNTEVLLCR